MAWPEDKKVCKFQKPNVNSFISAANADSDDVTTVKSILHQYIQSGRNKAKCPYAMTSSEPSVTSWTRIGRMGRRPVRAGFKVNPGAGLLNTPLRRTGAFRCARQHRIDNGPSISASTPERNHIGALPAECTGTSNATKLYRILAPETPH
jgi:hypothetical protein